MPSAPGRLRRASLVVLVNLVAIGALLGCAELYVRHKRLPPYHREYPGQHHEPGSVAWARADPLLGWTIAPGYLPGQINPQGFRDAKDFDNWPLHAGRHRVLLLGDSFVVGAHLRPEQTLPGLLQSGLGETHEVFTVAVPGWGIDQMYLAYERYNDLIAPDVVVLAFIDDDVKRVLEAYRVAERLQKPTLAVQDGILVRVPLASTTPSWMDRFARRSVFASLMVREFYLATDAKAIVGQVFVEMARDSARRSGRFVVVRIPTRDDNDWVNRIRRYVSNLRAPLSGTGGIFLDVAVDTSDSRSWSPDLYVEDGHLNAGGTERLATAILARLRGD